MTDAIRPAASSPATEELEPPRRDPRAAGIQDMPPLLPELELEAVQTARLTLSERYQRAVNRVRQEMPPDAGPQVRRNLARVIDLMEVLMAGPRALERMAVAELALERMLRAPRDAVLADQLIRDLRARLGGRIRVRWLRSALSAPPLFSLLSGLGLSLLSLAVLLALLMSDPAVLLPQATIGAARVPTDLLSRVEAVLERHAGPTAGPRPPPIAPDLHRLAVMGYAGALGAAASVMSRSSALSKRARAPWPDLLCGLVKPWLGFFSSTFIVSLLEPALLTAHVPGSSRPGPYLAVAFACGFLERLVRDPARGDEGEVQPPGRSGPRAAGPVAIRDNATPGNALPGTAGSAGAPTGTVTGNVFENVSAASQAALPADSSAGTPMPGQDDAARSAEEGPDPDEAFESDLPM